MVKINLSDTICDQSDEHRQAFCNIAYHNIGFCNGGAGKWKVMNESGLYIIDENATVELDNCLPTSVPTSDPTSEIIEETEDTIVDPNQSNADRKSFIFASIFCILCALF